MLNACWPCFAVSAFHTVPVQLKSIETLYDILRALVLRLSIAGDAPASPKGQYLVDLEAAVTLHQ